MGRRSAWSGCSGGLERPSRGTSREEERAVGRRVMSGHFTGHLSVLSRIVEEGVGY